MKSFEQVSITSDTTIECCVVIVSLVLFVDFVYPDFNETTGIVFNGDSGTTVCWDDPDVCY